MAEKEKQFKHYPVDVKVRNFCGKSKLFFLLTLILYGCGYCTGI